MTVSDDALVDIDVLLETTQTTTIRQAISLFERVGMASRNLAARTRVEYRRDLQDLAAYLEGRGVTQLRDVYLAHLEAYQAEMDCRGYTAATRRRKSQSIKGFFRFLYRQSILLKDIGARLIPPRQPKREPRFLSEREYKELLRACSHHPRDAALIEVLLQTGLRLAEVTGFSMADLELPVKPTPDPDNVGYVRVRRKGGKLETVPLNYKACRALKAYLAVRPGCEEDAVWITKFRTPMKKRAIQAAVAKYLQEIGVEGASVHTLRHTMATHHVARGTDLKTVQETLGHADLATTALYVSLARKAQRKALQEHAL